MKHTRIIVTRYGGPDALQLIEEEVGTKGWGSMGESSGRGRLIA